jgi:hypothetical protein
VKLFSPGGGLHNHTCISSRVNARANLSPGQGGLPILAMRPRRATEPVPRPILGCPLQRLRHGCPMKLRCKPGILAMVIHDTPRCRMNIGRIVWVRGPLEVNRSLRLACWLIKPVTTAPYAVEHGRRLVVERVFWRMRIEHPDRWLLPLEGLDGSPKAVEELLTLVPAIPQVNWDIALAEMLHRLGADEQLLR